MNLDDLKDRFATEGRQTWERVQESALYNQLRDRYDNMTPVMQKVSVLAVVVLISLFILSFPYGSFSESQDYVAEFESKRATIRELLKVTRESAEVPQIPPAPAIDVLRSTIENQLKTANILPEQIKGSEVLENNSQIVPKNLTEGLLQVSLAKLNLMQILDLGYGFQNISPSVKMKDLLITANREDSRYFDVVYKMVSLAVPAAPEAPPPEPPRNRRNRNNDSSEE